MAVTTILPYLTPAGVRLELPHDEITDLALDLHAGRGVHATP